MVHMPTHLAVELGPNANDWQRPNEISLKRGLLFAEKLVQMGCSQGHPPICYNLAVMFTQGDAGAKKSDEKAKEYQDKTKELVKQFGGFGMAGM